MPNVFQEKGFNDLNEVWWQRDGASSHTARISRATITQLFPGRFIGKFGDIHWTVRSTDLYPLDFFLWGTIKDHVYKHETLPANNVILQQRIYGIQK